MRQYIRSNLGLYSAMNENKIKSQVSERWVEIDDLRVRCLDWNSDGSVPVLALHGLASSAHWYDIVCPLMPSTFRILAPDQRGHGQTTQAASGYDWDTLAKDMINILDYMGIDKIGVIGHSWGATVAIALAACYPARITSLTIIDGGFGRSNSNSDEDWDTIRRTTFPRNVSGTRQEFLDRIRKQLDCCWNGEVERIVQTMVWEDEFGQMHDILHPDNHIQVMKAMWERPASDMWGEVVCPSMIIPAGPLPVSGHMERFWNKQSRVALASKGLRASRVHWIQETIHDIGYHRPDYLVDVISSFLLSNNVQQA